MPKTIYRYEVPIDYMPHRIELSSDPLSVATADHAYMEFWAETDGGQGRVRTFQVYGAGHIVPDSARYVGTGQRTSLGLVFHLYELEA